MKKIDYLEKIRFTKDTKLDFDFYQLPIFLFDEEFKNISNDSKILYSIMRDRHNLSLINNWIDKNNRVYIYMQKTEMCNFMNRTSKTIKKSLDELIDNNLGHARQL